MINIDVITASKLYRASSPERKTAILNYFNARLPVQDPEDIETVDTGDGSIDMDDVIDDRKNDDEADELEERLNRSRDKMVEKEKGETSKEPKDSEGPDKDQDRKPPSGKSDSTPKRTGNEPGPNGIPGTSGIGSSNGVDGMDAVVASLPRTHVTNNMNLEVLDIKELLNLNEETSGANRVEVKNDSELWVYYNDDVDTGGIMIDVIGLLNRPGYTYLQFNRLARSNNAIVFSINKEDTDYRKKFESEIEDAEAGEGEGQQ